MGPNKLSISPVVPQIALMILKQELVKFQVFYTNIFQQA